MRFNLETNEEIVRISYGAEKIQTAQYIRTPHSLLLQMTVTTDNKQRGDLVTTIQPLLAPNPRVVPPVRDSSTSLIIRLGPRFRPR